MEAFYDENGRNEGVRKWGLGRAPPQKDLGFKGLSIAWFHCRQMSTAYWDEGHWEERQQPISTGFQLRFQRGRGGEGALASAFSSAGDWWVGVSLGLCCSLPPGACCFCTQAAFCASTQVLVTFHISVNNWSAKIQFWAHPCFEGALLLRRALLSWSCGWSPDFILLFLSFFSSFFILSPFQHRWQESPKDVAVWWPYNLKRRGEISRNLEASTGGK